MPHLLILLLLNRYSLLVLRHREALLAVPVIFPPNSSTAAFKSSLFLLSLPTANSFMPVRGLSTRQKRYYQLLSLLQYETQFLINVFTLFRPSQFSWIYADITNIFKYFLYIFFSHLKVFPLAVAQLVHWKHSAEVRL